MVDTVVVSDCRCATRADGFNVVILLIGTVIGVLICLREEMSYVCQSDKPSRRFPFE